MCSSARAGPAATAKRAARARGVMRMGVTRYENSLPRYEIANPDPDQAPRLWRDCVGNSLSIANRRKNRRCGHFSALFDPKCVRWPPDRPGISRFGRGYRSILMKKLSIFAAAGLLAATAVAPSLADEPPRRHHRHHYSHANPLPYPISYLHNYGPG